MRKTYDIVGLMSGTSLDGLDIAFCEFQVQKGSWTFGLKAQKSVPYDKSLHQALKSSIRLSALELLLLNNEYGKWLGEQVNIFVAENDLQPDIVASHGHTVYHQPQKGLTYQIGAGQEIANACGLDVICDFRSLDVSLGGQGAPLVPIGDQWLFGGYEFCLNLGGISNMSFEKNGERVAYDIGIANMVLNHLTAQIGKSYDENGHMAKSGNRDEGLFRQLNDLPYYHHPFPKSTGYEWFCEEVVPIVDSVDMAMEDKLCTCVHHIAYQVSEAVKNNTSNTSSKLLITGGGALNSFLMEVLQHYLQEKVKVVIPARDIIEFKEAIVFAFMGALKLTGQPNCLKSVTGAKRDSSGGVLFQAT